MKINKYLPVAVVYFFINTLGLPFGVSYSTLLAPLFYFWVVSKRKKEILWPFLLAMSPFVLVQLATGVNTETYIPAFFNATCVYIFCQTVYTFLLYCQDVRGIFRSLFYLNFFMSLVAVPLFFTSYSDILWISQYLTDGVADFRRFRMFAYEASIYATQFTPLFLYFYLQSVFGFTRRPVMLTVAMLALPMMLSFSMGVIGAILVSLLLEGLLLFRYLARRKPFWLFGLSAAILFFLGIAVVVIFFPGNVLFHRIDNIFGGKDVSGKGRTSDAFVLAARILDLKNVFFGIGPGQLKVIGTEIVKTYYGYPANYQTITIPNTTAETMMVYGVIGLCVRFAAEIFLFFRTRVWTNYYRLALFLFVFIYQFTGSFITNVAEFVIWILAFTNCFPEFDVQARTLFNDPKPVYAKIGDPQSV